MLKIILILLVIAGVAAILGMGRVSGVALTGAKIVALVGLVLFLLVLIGAIAVA